VFDILLIALLTAAQPAAQQRPVAVDYSLNIDSANLNALTVQMRIRNAPPSFMVAAHAHPEYDDKYWRYLEGMRADGATITRADSVRWQVSNARRDLTLHYTIRLPESQIPRAAWRAYLTPRGGVVGGPHSFLYIVGAEQAPAHVRLVLPRGWSAATALQRNSDGRLQAANTFALMEAPIMVGNMREWRFDVARVPHRVYYLPGNNPVAFDTAAFLRGIQRIVEQTVNVFRSTPYREYLFLIADDAYGGLEHPNSVTLGARSSELAENPFITLPEIGHEFFHTWNLMRIRPREYRGVDYKVQPPVSTLWFSEGLSIYYADLLMRRAGFIMPDPDRRVRFQNLLSRYMTDPAYDRFSAEAISRVEYNSSPGALGNYDPSIHQLGEIIAYALDLIVRGATNGRRTMDDVMRAMNERYGTTGFMSDDVERVVADVCGCNARPFFDAHVRGAGRIDMNRYLEPLGLRMTTTRVPARLESGEIERDFRIRAAQTSPQDTLRLMLWNPESIWVRAGLNTNDRVLSLNGVAVRSWPEFRTQVAAVPMGGQLIFEIVRNGQTLRVPVTMAGYQRARVEITPLPNATAAQIRLRQQWEGNL
jgi:predicted metalloprotease with PDZ domain